MTERDIFLAAIDLPNPASRGAYLDKICAGDAALRAKVEALLHSHDAAGSFLKTPAVVPPAPAEAGTHLFTPTPDPTVTSGAGSSHPSEEEALAFLAPPGRADSLGRLGHYEVLQILGRGGFGIVFRAFDNVLERIVALKVMAPMLAATSPARKRFLREARSSAAVRHENVVQVYEVAEQPLPYLVMEFIPGETLQQRLDRMGPLDVAETLRIGRQIAEGLAAAHATDLIHRDIKPGNVLLEGGQQRVKITDFGLARAADDASISQSGIIAGTPMYMAPEQALGNPLDQRADLFSLGSVLYQMAAGRAPFRANNTVAVLKRVAEDTPRAIREITPETPQWLCDIISKLHAKNPDDRYQSAREVADVLADCEAQLKTNSKLKDFTRIPRVKPAPRSPRRSKWAALAAAVLLPAIVLAATEFAGVTHLFRGQPATTDSIKTGSEPTPLADGWVRLFNGKDLAGWKTHRDQPGQWRVDNGCLVGSGVRSHLFTERSDFENFRLLAEVKGNELSNSGILFRAGFGIGENGRTPNGYEAEIAHKYGRTGSLIIPIPGTVEPRRAELINVLPADQWLTLEVIAVGNRIAIKVNGTTTTDYVDSASTYQRGHLALQVYEPGTVVQFRRIEIKELPATPAATQPLPPTYKNGIGMEFALVPKGKSWLGGGKDKPADKEVQFPADFYLGKYEVTQEEWQKVTGKNPSAHTRTGGCKDAVKDVTDADLKRFPVEYVSRDQCQTFVDKLNKLEREPGWEYRLPTEEEWEYACRGGPMSDKRDSTFDFYFAKPTNTLLPAQANFNNGLKRPCKVGSYEPNVLGLYDMHGNVAEWCEGWEVRDGDFQAAAADCRAESSSKPIDGLGNNGGLGLRVARVRLGVLPPEVKALPPAEAAQAKELQEMWAKKLGVPVEYTNSLGMKFRLIPPGTFTMGSSPEEIERFHKSNEERHKGRDADWGRNLIASEGPAHEVEITQPFYLGATHVTVGQYRKFADARKEQLDKRWENPGWEQSDEYPAVNVTWINANGFCEWLGKREGQAYRLPTEAEWEYSCRAGTTARYWFGDDGDVAKHAWTKSNSEGKTHPVKQFDANPFGLYDTYGNAWQWCLDLNDLELYKKSPRKDPRGTGNGHIVRGGSWGNDPLECRSAVRNATSLNLGLQQSDIGFRALLTVDAVRQALFADADVKRIAALPPAEQVEEVRKELKKRNPASPFYATSKTENEAVAELWIHEAYELTDISPVRALTGLKSFRCDAGAGGDLVDVSPLASLKNLTHVYLGRMKVGDEELVHLKGCADLTSLFLEGSKIGDAGLAHLKDFKNLTSLTLNETRVTDLTPLKDLKLASLSFQHTAVKGLAPLKDMKLTELNCKGTQVIDLSPLKALPLKELWCDFKAERDAEILRSIKTLEKINGKPAEEFWKDGKEK